jgi:hypothetical protein
LLTHNKITKSLKEKDIELVAQGEKIYIDNRKDHSIPLENHYGISLEKQKWSYCFYELEKRNIPKITVIKQFETKEQAENYLFLRSLNDYFMFNYVVPNRDYNLEHWSLQTILEDMKRLKIPINYFSYETNVYANSIIYKEKNGKWYAGYINKQKKQIYEMPNGNEDKDWFLSLYANDVFVLYLFDQYEEDLLAKKEINKTFTDNERLIVLNYL